MENKIVPASPFTKCYLCLLILLIQLSLTTIIVKMYCQGNNRNVIIPKINRQRKIIIRNETPIQCFCSELNVPTCFYLNPCAKKVTNSSKVQWMMTLQTSPVLLHQKVSCQANKKDFCFNPTYIDESILSLKSTKMLQGLHAFIVPYVAYNPGHVLGDNIWPIYQSMHLFGLDKQPVNVVSSKGNPKYQKMYSLLSDNKIMVLDTLFTSSISTVCFEKLLVGWEAMGYATHSRPFERLACHENFTTVFWDFRQLIMKRFKVSETSTPHSMVVRFLLRDNKGEHPSNIHNLRQVITALHQGFFKRNIQIVVSTFQDFHTMKDQIVAMVNTDILISLPGANLMAALYMGRDKHVIIPARTLNGKMVVGSNEADIWLKQSHILVDEFYKYTTQVTPTNVTLNVNKMIQFVHNAATQMCQKHIVHCNV